MYCSQVSVPGSMARLLVGTAVRSSVKLSDRGFFKLKPNGLVQGIVEAVLAWKPPPLASHACFAQQPLSLQQSDSAVDGGTVVRLTAGGPLNDGLFGPCNPGGNTPCKVRASARLQVHSEQKSLNYYAARLGRLPARWAQKASEE